MAEHGDTVRTANGGRGIHGIIGHANVANDAARTGLTQGALDELRFLKQTAGAIPGYYYGDGGTKWWRLSNEPAVVTTAALTGNINNYLPVSAEAWQYGDIFRVATTVPVLITGFAAIAAAPRSMRQVLNINGAGGDNITIGHLNGSSSAGNQVFIATEQDLVVPPGGNVTLWEDTVTGKWRVM